MKKFILYIFTLTIISTTGVFAQNGAEDNTPWRISVGPSYRTFEGIELESFDFTPGANTFINGTVTDVGAGNYEYTVMDSVKQVDNATLDRIEYQNAILSADDENLQDAPGAVVRGNRSVLRREGFTLDFELSLMTAFVNDDLSATPSTTTSQFDISPNTWPSQGGGPGGGPDPDPNERSQTYQVYNRSQINSPISEVNARVDYNFDMDVYTLGAGVTVKRDVGPVKLKFGGGPSLSIIPYDVQRRATAAWASDGTTFFTRYDSTDRGIGARAGMYARAGAQYELNERIAVGIGGRYDWVPDDLNTDYAEFELSGFSGMLSVTYSF